MGEPDCVLCRRQLADHWDSVRDADTLEQFTIKSCRQCGLLMTFPVPEDLAPYYEHQYCGGRHGITAKMCDRRRERIVNSFFPNRRNIRLLDVGCGDGTFVGRASQAGWDAWGVEIFPELARESGLRVFETLEEAQCEQGYDCITLWHVLEHLTDLESVVEQISKLLAPQGILVVAVPNSGSVEARLFGPRWLHLDVPRHVYHFTEPALKSVLEKQHLRPQRLRGTEFEYDMMGWVQSALNCLSSKPNLFFKIVTGRNVEAGVIERLFHLAIGVGLCCLVWLPVLCCNLLGLGGTLIMSARKAPNPDDV